MVRFYMPGYRRLGTNIIKIIGEILNKHNINWSLGYGTLLSYKVLGDFFDNDRDVDIDIWDVDDNDIKLIKDEIGKHFPLEFERKYKNKYTYLIAYRIKNMRIDIHVWTDGKDGFKYRFDKQKNGKLSCYRMSNDIFVSTKSVFRNVPVYVYKDTITYLRSLYTDEWNIYKDESQFSVKTDAPCLITLDECPL